jgi:lysophospholipase L1-like esterase
MTSKCTDGTNIDQNHEGHPGSQAAEFVAKGNLTGWLNANPPDVILMLLGTNDVLIGKRSVDDILASYDILVSQMRKKNANMQIVFSNLLPLDPAKWPATAVKGIKDLNAAIATYAPKKSTLKSPVYFVDNFAGFDVVKDTDSDGEHPNLTTGVQKMAAKFLEPTKTAIRAAAAVKARRVKRAERLTLE